MKKPGNKIKDNYATNCLFVYSYTHNAPSQANLYLYDPLTQSNSDVASDSLRSNIPSVDRIVYN